MSFFKNVFFKSGDDKNNDLSDWEIPFEAESEERKAYESWVDEGELSSLMDALKSEYGFYLTPGEEHAEWVDFLNVDGANGILIHTQKISHPVSNWLFVAEFMKDRALSWGYKLYSSSKMNADTENTPPLFRHYLKPPIKNMLETPIDQIFGNVTIELAETGTVKETLKIQIQHYSDRNYQEARNIEDLYYSLFNRD